MTPEDKELLDIHVKAMPAAGYAYAKILYKNTPSSKIETFECIETAVRDQVLEHVSPKIAFFFVGEKTGTTKGKTRTIRSCVAKIKVTNKQASRLGIETYRRFSPLLEKCCDSCSI
uniref:Uncharacterized protein n=1 Tax=Nostoc flagelliforme str. Sunitezuoqi TaxID=676037 RepID=E7DPR3_9NOSO|nr:hypothetical protein Nfla_3901 [Nostoc flagelliforme str. Sunitezuoqi]